MIKIVTSNDWATSYTSYCEIKGYRLNVYRPKSARFINGRYQCRYGDLDGTVYETKEQGDIVALERGYTQRYSRNMIKFVQSRAARKHGYVSQDWLYNLKANRYKH